MKKTKKIAKGYRLKPETHKMIREIQKIIRGNIDDSLNLACRRLINDMRKDKNKIVKLFLSVNK